MGVYHRVHVYANELTPSRIGHIKAGLPSWKFEFLIIGALCCVWGVVMMIFLPDSPVTAKGLNEREKRVAIERLRDNQTGIENKHLKWYQVREAFTEYVYHQRRNHKPQSSHVTRIGASSCLPLIECTDL
jgi:sugar phosphate permease